MQHAVLPLRFLQHHGGNLRWWGSGWAGAWQALLVKETMSTAVVSGGNSAVNLKIETERGRDFLRRAEVGPYVVDSKGCGKPDLRRQLSPNRDARP